MLPIHDGIDPVRLLLNAKKYQSFCKLQIESGIEPLKPFDERLISNNSESCPIDDGIGPLSEFEAKYARCSKVICPKSGREPTRKLPSKCTSVNVLRFAIVAGIVPDSILLPK